MATPRDTLYVFGGELSFCNDQETPLWMYDIQVAGNGLTMRNHLTLFLPQTELWSKFPTPRGVVTPRGRRGHTALVWQDSM